MKQGGKKHSIIIHSLCTRQIPDYLLIISDQDIFPETSWWVDISRKNTIPLRKMVCKKAWFPEIRFARQICLAEQTQYSEELYMEMIFVKIRVIQHTIFITILYTAAVERKLQAVLKQSLIFHDFFCEKWRRFDYLALSVCYYKIQTILFIVVTILCLIIIIFGIIMYIKTE